MAQVQAGDMKGAQKTADMIHNSKGALQWIATLQAEAGNFEAALKTVETIPNDAVKALTLAAIATSQARAGDHQGATKNFERALNLAIERAVRVANNQADEDVELRTYLGRVGSMTERADNSAFVMIAGAQSRAGLTEAGKKYRPCRPGNPGGHGMAEDRRGAVALADRGDTKGALEAIEVIKVEDTKREAANNVITAVARKDLPGARRLADTVQDDLGRFYAHLAIAKAQSTTDRHAAVQMFQDVLGEAERLEDKPGGLRNIKPYALANLAKAQAEVGEENAALDWIEKESAPDAKARALWRVAEALIERQQTKQRGQK